MKKVLIFSLAYHPFVGGAEIAVQQITDRLSENEYYLITNRFDSAWPGEETIGNVHVRRVGQGRKIDKYLYPFAAYSYALKLSRTIKFDFVWSIMAFYAGIAALLFKQRTKTPYLLTMQSGDSDKFIRRRTWFWSFFYKQIYRQAKLTQVISQFLAKRSRKMGYKGEIYLVPNGVDLNIWYPKLSAVDREHLRTQMHIAPGQLALITTSRLALKNGLQYLIKAVNFLVYKSGINVKLIIIGTGPEEARLKNLSASIGVAQHVFFYGYKQYDHLPKYVQACDIFVRPSLSEGLGNSFLESMAVGTPVIATPVGGIPDFLKEEETGLFCQPMDAASIAAAVEKYMHNPSMYQKISENGQRLVEKNYSWDGVSAKMETIFEKMSA